MKRVKFVCRRCGHKFVVEIIEREEAIERRIATAPVRCEKCGCTSVERS